jgi:hypothetical protein
VAKLLPRLKDRNSKISLDLLKERAIMKLHIAAVSALTLMSLGVASAATTTYNFDNATNGDGNGIAAASVSFANGLTALGISSSSLTGVINPGTGGNGGVSDNGGGAPGTFTSPKGFSTGFGGVWTLIFGGATVNSFSFNYWETEANGGAQGTNGFSVALFAPNLTTQLGSTQVFGGGVGTLVTFSGLGQIGKAVITDLGDNQHAGGDGLQIDNLSVTTPDTTVPEPSTYLMIGSALAGLAWRRRRA